MSSPDDMSGGSHNVAKHLSYFYYYTQEQLVILLPIIVVLLFRPKTEIMSRTTETVQLNLKEDGGTIHVGTQT